MARDEAKPITDKPAPDKPATETSHGLDLGRRLVIRDIEIAGSGVIILTGPSSCGKGEIAKAMCELLSIGRDRWLSMGDILRHTYERARAPDFVHLLQDRYSISDDAPILDCLDTTPDLSRKVEEQAAPLAAALAAKRGAPADWRTASQLDWLEYCTTHGLLVPNRWTQALIAAHIEQLPDLDSKIFLLDGYPRTRVAAKHLLDDLAALNLPVLKVLHLSISKQEMLHRAGMRGRIDDDPASLLKRYEFYIESVQPSVDYLKEQLGADRIALIDAHQPHYGLRNGTHGFDLERSIENVVRSALRGLGLPRFVIDRMIASRALAR
ncbi:MAG TPA: nucleoside monophosphate kinase [Stellaceae bacterium]|nr:nucleoside monophosphate kinase [Stellaceae bacterium]